MESPKYLPNLEVLCYFLLYSCALLRSIYSFYLVSTSSTPGYISFENTWKFLQRKRDNTDYEWETWGAFINQILWVLGTHLLIMELVRALKIKKFSLVSGLLGMTFLTSQVGFLASGMFFLKTILFYWIGRYKRKYLVWLMVTFWMIANNLPQAEEYLYQLFAIDDIKIYLLFVALGWNTLKCVSFTIDKIENGDKGLHYNFMDYLGYVFYIPTLFMGPITVYERHRQMLLNMGSEKVLPFIPRLKNLIGNSLYIYILYLLTHGAMYYLYVNNVQYYPDQILPKLSSLGLYGYGYLMGQFFHHKYVIFYGIGITLGKFDNINMPQKPRCISRTHRYTDMWKYFDHGLYEFLFKYIYTQLCTKKSNTIHRLSSVFVTFVFIYVWHGLMMSIFVWSALNFGCLVLENFLRALFESMAYKNMVRKYLSSNNELRLNALIATNLMIPSILSNFIFFAGTTVGYEFFKRTYTSGVRYYFTLLVICNAIYHTAEWICRYEKKKKLVEITKD